MRGVAMWWRGHHRVARATVAAPVAWALLTSACGRPAPKPVQKEIVTWKSLGEWSGSGNAQTLTEDDAKALVRDVPAVQAAAPASRGTAQVVYGNNNWGTQIMGSTPDYLSIRDLQVAEGQAFTTADVDSAAKVALLGKTVADNLFNGEDPVGKVIRIKKVPFTVSGVLEAKGQSPPARTRTM